MLGEHGQVGMRPLGPHDGDAQPVRLQGPRGNGQPAEQQRRECEQEQARLREDEPEQARQHARALEERRQRERAPVGLLPTGLAQHDGQQHRREREGALVFRARAETSTARRSSPSGSASLWWGG